jgi:hypothetical protein
MRDPQQGVALPVSNTGLFMIGATARWIEDYDRYCGQKSRWAYISPVTPLPRCKRWKSLTLGKQAAAIAVAHEAKGDEAWARFLIGRAYWASEPKDLDESEKQLDIALRLATACEARPLAAFCNTTLCGIYAQRGDQVRAKGIQCRGDCNLPGTRHATTPAGSDALTRGWTAA